MVSRGLVGLGLILLLCWPGSVFANPVTTHAVIKNELTSDFTSFDPTPFDEYPEFERLQQVIEHYGFIVRLELPPRTGNYGMLQINSRTIWVNPVVFELDIAQNTLVHEAVHAAQVCANPDELLPLALDLEPPHIVRPYFMRYSGTRRLVEAEAYTVQALENSVDYVIGLLQEHCP